MTEEYKKTTEKNLEKIAELRKELFKLSYKILDLEEDLERFKNETLRNIEERVKENFELKKDILK